MHIFTTVYSLLRAVDIIMSVLNMYLIAVAQYSRLFG